MNYQRQACFVAGSMLLLGLMSASSVAQEWGTLKGRFVVDGDVGEPPKINVTKDTEYCGKHDLHDETLVVGDDGGVANVFVYIYTRRGQSVDIHPDLQSPPEEPVVLDNEGCRFEPHALTVRTGQPLEIRNSDPGIGHNTNAQLLSNPTFNEMVTAQSPIKKTFTKGEVYPATVACNVHPWMNAYMLIREDPYMAVSDKDGTFEIEKIPAGEHQFIFWHEASGNLRSITVGDEETDRRGRAKLEIPEGDTLDLGEVKLSPSALGK